jgi:DNA-binding Xre family transcriptional regulator
MRYDIVTKDSVDADPDFSRTPGQPVTAAPPVRVVTRDEARTVSDALTPSGTTESHPELEDSVVPLFPDDDRFLDPDYQVDTAPPPLRGQVRLRLDEVARLRGVVNHKGKFRGMTNLSAIQRGTGLAYATLNKLLRAPQDQTGISFDVLTRLCEFLHCQPGDLLVWEPRASEPQTSISDYFQRREARASRSARTPVGEGEDQS